MIPVVTIDEMRAIDAAATEPTPVLVGRAGAAVARTARRMLGGVYGRRVVVLAGPGNNGADGRVAAARLRSTGVHAEVIDLADAPAALPVADLVIDAALGTGVSRPYEAPDPGAARVLAVDIPSGVHGDTGEVLGSPMLADITVTFAALKPGLLLGDGPSLCGRVEVVDIGLDVDGSTVHLVDDASAARMVPTRPVDAHKWHQAVLVVAGSPGMTGAAHLTTAAAQRAGAGMVRLATPGLADPGGPTEAVAVAVPETGWAEDLADGSDRIDAFAIGPGLGTSMAALHQMRMLIGRLDRPAVVDGDALTALGSDAATVLARRTAPTVLTPHDGEFARLAGAAPGPDRIGAVRSLAASTGAVVLLKGPTNVIAAPDGRVRLVRSGDERLATAGTGDVLTGVVAALLAGGASPLDAAAAGAHLHGIAGSTGPRPGTIASDVIEGLPAAFGRLRAAR